MFAAGKLRPLNWTGMPNEQQVPEVRIVVAM